MLIWLLVNVLLSGLALAFVRINHGAPHRLRFHVAVLALVCWLVPWSQLTQVSRWLPSLHAFDLVRAGIALAAKTAESTQVPLFIVDTRSVPLAAEFTLVNLPLFILLALLVSGLALFGWNLLQHHLRVRSLQHSAREVTELWHRNGIDADVPIYLQQQISGAFSSGILEPTVWVHADLAAAPELPTLLRHELTHIQQHDNAWLLLITLVEKVFWWNPLAWYLGKTARELQELSCDERCRHCDADYPIHLAQLMLANLAVKRSVAQEPLLLSANIFNANNPDIQRLKVLQRSHHMKPRHIVSAIATAVLAIASVGLVTAQQETGSGQAERNVRFVKIGSGPDAQDQVFNFMLKKDDIDQTADKLFGVKQIDGHYRSIKVFHGANGTLVSFKFENTALPVVLAPLAHMLSNINGMPVKRFIQDAEAGTVLKIELADQKTPILGSSLVKLEVDAAHTRQVTVSGTDLSLNEALDVIGKAANCNVIKNGDKLVVDWCGTDPNI